MAIERAMLALLFGVVGWMFIKNVIAPAIVWAIAPLIKVIVAKQRKRIHEADAQAIRIEIEADAIDLEIVEDLTRPGDAMKRGRV